MKFRIRNTIEIAAIIVLTVGAMLFLKPDTQPGQQAAVTSNSIDGNKSKPTPLQIDQAYKGVTIVPQAGTGKVLAVDLKGNVVHEWPLDADRARLLPNCHLLVVHGTHWGLKVNPWKKLSKQVREYDWNGNIVWDFTPPRKPHHDIQRLPNGNTLVLYKAGLPSRMREALNDPTLNGVKIITDGVMEVTPENKVIWNWKFYDHFKPTECGRSPCPRFGLEKGEKKEVFDWTHTNTIAPLPPNKWYDAGDTRFRPGNLIIHPRNWSQVMIVDKQTKEPVWKYGGTYKGGIRGGHEPHMIPKGLPGEGNIIIFDNGVPPTIQKKGHNGVSHIIEFNPVTKKIVWVYDAGEEFYSRAMGAAQRLPNGNTLVSEDRKGRVFEVNTAGEVVWEYLSDVRITRAKRYGYDYCSELVNLKNTPGVSLQLAKNSK